MHHPESSLPIQAAVPLDLHYTDERLVALYDPANTDRSDVAYYCAIADEIAAHTIIDLGCGTGSLTCALADGTRQITGIDPSGAMLAVARQRPGAGAVRWVTGTSANIGQPDADLVIMTGNVAQVFLDDDAWQTTLRHIFAAVRPGGWLAFESRNPEAREWEIWNRDQTFTRTATPMGVVQEWVTVTDVAGGCVHMQGYNVFENTGETVVATSILRFRTLNELQSSLNAAGFAIEQVCGNWQREPIHSTSPCIIVLARRPAT